MKGALIFKRRVILLTALVTVTVLIANYYWKTYWLEKYSEAKILEFVGNRLRVDVGAVENRTYPIITLSNVAFWARSSDKGPVFRLENVAIRYNGLLWEIIRRSGLFPWKKIPPNELGVYFSEENPFVRGFITFYSYREQVEVFGQVIPVVFGDIEKRGIKGVFEKNDRGTYDCDLLWDGRYKMTGILDPESRELALKLFPVDDTARHLAMKLSIDKDGNVTIYFRVYRWLLWGEENVGDIWITCNDREVPVFNVRSENYMINKRPAVTFTRVLSAFSSKTRSIFITSPALAPASRTGEFAVIPFT